MEQSQQEELKNNHAEGQQNEGLDLNSNQENMAENITVDELEKLRQELSAKQLECETLNDKLLRTVAELDNVRRRSREELEKTAKYAVTNFVSDLVVVVENFFMASKHAPRKELEENSITKNYFQAIEMTEKELAKILEKNQVRRIDPLGEQFDHNFHEAIARLDSEEEEGKILAVIQAGYTIGERLIRPALVSVAKKAS